MGLTTGDLSGNLGLRRQLYSRTTAPAPGITKTVNGRLTFQRSLNCSRFSPNPAAFSLWARARLGLMPKAPRIAS